MGRSGPAVSPMREPRRIASPQRSSRVEDRISVSKRDYDHTHNKIYNPHTGKGTMPGYKGHVRGRQQIIGSSYYAK